MLVSKGRLKIDAPLADFLRKVEQDFVVLPIRSQEAEIAMKLDLR
ncbi:MAG: type II toxin-antitoxin system VapC family toxin [Blastochloris sp.]|nr:type II toxin-antitoxin system VapC family toxin [Blastochloris sp.]